MRRILNPQENKNRRHFRFLVYVNVIFTLSTLPFQRYVSIYGDANLVLILFLLFMLRILADYFISNKIPSLTLKGRSWDGEE